LLKACLSDRFALNQLVHSSISFEAPISGTPEVRNRAGNARTATAMTKGRIDVAAEKKTYSLFQGRRDLVEMQVLVSKTATL